MNKENVMLSIWGTACLICLFAGVYMCIKDIEGWGWFLFSGVIVFASLSYSSDDKKESPPEEEED